MVIALLAAVITSFIVPPDEKYLDYLITRRLPAFSAYWQLYAPLKTYSSFIFSPAT